MASRKNSSPDDIIDLTELIEKGGAPAPLKVEAQVEHDTEEIAALLSDIDAVDAASTRAAGKVDANEKLDMSDMGDIDDLLNDLDIPAQPQTAASALDNAVDDLMGVTPKNDTPPPPGGGFADDLDALFDEKPASSAKAASGNDLDSDLDTLYASLGESPGASDRDQKTPGSVDSDLDDILSSLGDPALPAEEVASPKAAAAKRAPADFPDDLDALLNGTDDPLPEPKKTSPAKAAPAKPASPAAVKQPVEEIVQETEADHNIASAPAAPSPAFSEQHNFALNANIENLNFQARDLGTRLQNCEADLAKTRLRMEGLEKAAANSASIEDLLRDGSPLHTGFASLISSSVGQVIQDVRSNGPDPQTLNKLQQLEIGSKGAQSRLEALENRITDLEKERLANGEFAEKISVLVQNGDDAALRMDGVETRLETLLPQIEKSAQLADHYDEFLHASARLSALENSFGELAAKLEKTVMPEETLARIGAELSGVAEQQGGSLEKIADLSSRQDILLAKITENETGIVSLRDTQKQALDELAAYVSALSEKVGNIAAAQENDAGERLGEIEAKTNDALARLDDFGQRISEIDLSKSMAPLEAGVAQLTSATETRFDEHQAKIDDISARYEELAKSASRDMAERMDAASAEAGESRKRIEALENMVSSLQSADALSSLESRLVEVEKISAEERERNGAIYEELTQKIAGVANLTELDEKISNIGNDAQSAKIRVLALEDKFADLSKKDALQPLENSIQEIGELAKTSYAELNARMGELAQVQNELLKTRESFAALADESRQSGERISTVEERLASFDFEKMPEKYSSLATSVNALEDAAKSSETRIHGLETRLDALPGIESVETALLAKIGSMKQDEHATKEKLDVLENRLASLEARNDVESDIGLRLESISQETAASNSRLVKLEAAVDNLSKDLENNDPPKDIAQELKQTLENRIGQFEQKLAVLEEIATKTGDIAVQLQAIDKSVKSVAFRMDAVETRLDNLEPKFNKEVEKAAASAVSRILREEISRLMTNE